MGMDGLKALILDYGNVLSWPQNPESVEAMACRARVSIDAFRAAYQLHRDAYDTGLPAEEFWRRVLGTLGHPRSAPDFLATVTWLIHSDVESWTQYRDEVWDLVRSFRANGGRTAFLSNGVPEVMARIRAERPLESWFDVTIVSYEVGVAKPDPRIYRICIGRLGVDPKESLFVDDREENVEAAVRLGIRTLHFTGDHSVDELRALVLKG